MCADNVAGLKHTAEAAASARMGRGASCTPVKQQSDLAVEGVGVRMQA